MIFLAPHYKCHSDVSPRFPYLNETVMMMLMPQAFSSSSKQDSLGGEFAGPDSYEMSFSGCSYGPFLMIL